MALWGNNDNRTAQGTVTLDYATGICTGSNQEAYGAGTQFGESGSIQVGDVIRFGDRVKGGGKAYFGEAIVVSIASTTSLTIGSTANLSGVLRLLLQLSLLLNLLSGVSLILPSVKHKHRDTDIPNSPMVSPLAVLMMRMVLFMKLV